MMQLLTLCPMQVKVHSSLTRQTWNPESTSSSWKPMMATEVRRRKSTFSRWQEVSILAREWVRHPSKLGRGNGPITQAGWGMGMSPSRDTILAARLYDLLSLFSFVVGHRRCCPQILPNSTALPSSGDHTRVELLLSVAAGNCSQSEGFRYVRV